MTDGGGGQARDESLTQPNHRIKQVSVDRNTEITLTLTTAHSILESSTKDRAIQNKSNIIQQPTLYRVALSLIVHANAIKTNHSR